ncbi:tRNA (adenosine(37)-N6)-threonylcarbamoyltransferase complex dimerization subunit type 1 TsaB [Gimesia algae]|uniref:tRNA threonylcarbamoyladenosine biosynthesis protein TsaB n=1 Tax=Gimesia algae TaxID=2527971 RepID=A0A517V8M0_9PLAN|nr:tRNA (adenosine(37)-N6)-threonylcarbamoyltransferase complex dimerization subunit type 1 TsaB [Gimesia algae]QDT89332.1 tRNA threonylcarbamoyladenosine biosynthesis protein TsaB [Gimesia algae]
MENSEFYLGIESSGLSGSVAIYRPGQQITQIELPQQGRKHAQTLVAEVKNLLEQLNITARQITGVGVSRGPGSFTGLRIGITFAKTFGYVTGCPVLGIDTFEAIALKSPSEITETWVISNAQRGDLFVGKYLKIGERHWQNTSEIELRGIEEFGISLQSSDTVSGPGITLLPDDLPSDPRLLQTEFRTPHAAEVAEITARMMQEHAAKHSPRNEVWNLVPFYLRKSAAEEKWDAQQNS